MTDDINMSKEMENGLQDMALGMSGNNIHSPLSNDNTLYFNLRWYLISNNRQLLSELYVEHGVVQTLVDQPVDDAFRSGFEIETKQLSADQKQQLQYYLEKNKVIHSLKQAMKWTRLFGGGGLLIITEQDSSKPLNVEALKDTSKIEFRAVDMWEITGDWYGYALGNPQLEMKPEYFSYYGVKVHSSRVYVLEGKEAPSFVRPRLRGWGMSVVEKIVRSLNQYMKNQDVVYELLDEAKIDIYQIDGLNNALMNKDGTDKITRRIQAANMIKSYLNALTMDTKDKYEQKQMQFTGLADMLPQIRQGLAADLKMPITKLFGVSAAGFNSGEDDIENYNSMIEGEIRSQCKFMVLDVLQICCQKLFGMIPTDLMIEFNPLRILSAKEEEEVKDLQFRRIKEAYTVGLISPEEAKQSINHGALLNVSIDENDEAYVSLQKKDGTGAPESNNKKDAKRGAASV